ncbi:hypothetical protein M422DRAFT_263565 [Sphaerobolus stellatus SS14]|uniref:Uncharacterized protein n=1 Tax=Sphaerobolus stellatus (strain SS14) TaxID=990650 RepID=A0A0C9UYT8_SPHS4|nr:hypothetical protein M422DRAFT_263565 [Sphaerobolus stellatus SS14]
MDRKPVANVHPGLLEEGDRDVWFYILMGIAPTTYVWHCWRIAFQMYGSHRLQTPHSRHAFPPGARTFVHFHSRETDHAKPKMFHQQPNTKFVGTQRPLLSSPFPLAQAAPDVSTAGTLHKATRKISAPVPINTRYGTICFSTAPVYRQRHHGARRAIVCTSYTPFLRLIYLQNRGTDEGRDSELPRATTWVAGFRFIKMVLWRSGAGILTLDASAPPHLVSYMLAIGQAGPSGPEAAAHAIKSEARIQDYLILTSMTIIIAYCVIYDATYGY